MSVCVTRVTCNPWCVDVRVDVSCVVVVGHGYVLCGMCAIVIVHCGPMVMVVCSFGLVGPRDRDARARRALRLRLRSPADQSPAQSQSHALYTIHDTASAAPRITITHHTLTLKAVQDGEA